jgi:hypothetical protein
MASTDPFYERFYAAALADAHRELDHALLQASVGQEVDKAMLDYHYTVVMSLGALTQGQGEKQ